MFKVFLFVAGIILDAIGSWYYTPPQNVNDTLEKTHAYLDDAVIN